VDDSLATRVRAVLFDRDGTLIHNVPYLADPEGVRPVAGAREVLDRLRQQGLRIGIVSNQSGVARGLITPDELTRVNARVVELLGPFDTIQTCPHAEADGCGCRKPAPGMVLAAARALAVHPGECVVVGDIAADLEAARRAGAAAYLVPNAATLPNEVAAARDRGVLVADLHEAAERVLVGVG
jgi:D-glycero-D-manno-heptose 1,7-bisphosphate phosphatase